MPLVSRILVPVEFSPRCRGAVQYAAAIACHLHCEIALLHVVMPFSNVYGSPEGIALAGDADVTTGWVAQTRADLETFMGEELKGLSVTREVLEGDPAPAIADYSAAGKFGLIVMPTHGYGPFRRFLLGSVTAKVLHDAPCPVWTGPHMEQAPDRTSIRFRKVFSAIDLGPDSRAVLGWAAGFAREFGAALTIVYAIPDFFGGIYFDAEWRTEVAKNARAQISSLAAELPIHAEVSIETGDVPAAVSGAAQQGNADVMVIGRGRAPAVLGRLRTNAYAILRESPCPVVTV